MIGFATTFAALVTSFLMAVVSFAKLAFASANGSK